MDNNLNFGRNIILTVANGDEGIVIENLRIDFVVNKNDKKKANTAEISIYNLSGLTRKKILREFKGVELRAGYGENVDILFVGYIRTSKVVKRGSDIVLTLKAGEGDFDFKTKVINKTYIKTAIQEVLQDLVSRYSDLTSGLFDRIDEIPIPQRPIVLSGTIFDAINTLSDRYGFKWSVNNNNIDFRKNEAVHEGSFYIDSNSGLVGIPEQGQNDLLKITALLNPLFTLGRLIKVRSKFLEEIQLANNNPKKEETEGDSGVFRIDTIIHRGSNYGGFEFYSILECRRYVPS